MQSLEITTPLRSPPSRCMWPPNCRVSCYHCYPKGCAAPGEVQCQCNTRGSLSKLKRTPPQAKINVTSKSPVGDISVVTLIRTDTTLDHSQKAEKVCSTSETNSTSMQAKIRVVRTRGITHKILLGPFSMAFAHPARVTIPLDCGQHLVGRSSQAYFL